MKRTFCLTALALLPFSAAPALAQCVESPTNTYVCSGLSDGFTDGSDGVGVTVNSGATVSRVGNDALRLRGLGSTVVNNGTINGIDGNDGIDGGHSLTVTNSGTITAENKAIDADDKANLTVVNTGVITATDKAIRNGDGSNSSLQNSGTIRSDADEGFESGDGATVVNSGLIVAQDDAVQVGEDALITNSGTIRSFRNLAAGAEQQDGIDIDSGAIVNETTGVIEAEANAGIDFDGSTITSFITNSGRISGTTGILVDKGEDDPTNENTAAQIMFNYGIIEGTDGLAVDVGAGDDELSLFGGSTLIGGIDMGTGDDTLNLFDDLAGNIAGGAILDGGAGVDLVDFKNLTIANVLRAWSNSKVLSLIVDTPQSSFRVALSNWEDFQFGDDVYDRDQILAVAPVPLPAAGLMMLAGLGGLAALRRRRV